MKKIVQKLLLMAIVAGMSLPIATHAAEDDLQKKLDKLTREVADLKEQVRKDEDKALNKWLTIGGEYRFRLDSLHGKTVPYSDALGTMSNLVGGFTGPAGIAGTNTGGTFTSPNATQFIMQGKAGTLFTPAQFNTILTQYMPQAMYGGIQQLITTANPMQAYFAPGAAVPAAVLQATALTSQQQSILNTLSAKVMPTVMAMSAAPFGAPGMTVGQLFNSGAFSADQAKLLNNLLMQSFLGAGGTNLTQVPAYKPKNETLYTNKFALDLTAKATQNVTVHAKLDMYKSFGSQSDSTTMGNYFADRVGAFDGTLSHVPSDSLLNVDRAFATWSNIADQPI
ncbi:MAG: DUF3373 family protein, partial [Desulfuromonadaceae bacterium]|nr:DUF3373 family protein [Desulfuromonadaceae bacterium]